MAFDDTWKIVDAELNTPSGADVFRNATGAAFDTDGGNSVTLGRTGLPFGAQFTVILDNPGGAGTAAKNVACVLQLSLDNESTWRNIATVELGNFEGGFQGQVSQDIARSLAWEQYADTNIEVRVLVDLTGANNSQNVTADKLACYITQGEVTKWGRNSAADTLFV